MKILIIGGTYFLGKAFLELADNGENRLTVLNRGNRRVSGNEDGHVKELRADRKNEAELRNLQTQWDPEGYDCVVDFCAYETGDLGKLMDVLPDGVKQYVLISTSDVYRRGSKQTLREDAEFETRDFGGEAGAYVLGKVQVEKELRELAGKRGIHFTSIRPAFIYGPYNYAPREGIYFQWIKRAGQILMPEDADGSFQMVYVKDVARVILACLLEEKAYDAAYNVCGETITYQAFADALEAATGTAPERVGVPIDVINEKGIPLPFPMTREESECYDGSKAMK